MKVANPPVSAPPAARACSACAAPLEGSALVCSHCGEIQAPSNIDYFSVFALQPRLNLDFAALECEFHRLSRKLHPDRFARASEQERQWSIAGAALLNDAWRTLKDPLRRTEYLLNLRSAGASERIDDSVSARAPVDLLEEVFDLNLQLEDLRTGRYSGPSDPQPNFKLAKEKFESLLAQVDSDLRVQWTAWDEGDSTSRANAEAAMTGLLDRRSYLGSLLREVNQTLE